VLIGFVSALSYANIRIVYVKGVRRAPRETQKSFWGV